MTAFCKWILTEFPHSTLGSVFTSPSLFFASWKESTFFLAMPCPSLLAGLSCTFKTLSGWFRKLRPVPSNSNLNQALNYIGLNPDLLQAPFSYWLLFSQLLIILPGLCIKLHPALPWLMESLILTSYHKLWLQSLVLLFWIKPLLRYVFPFLSPIRPGFCFTGFALCQLRAISFNAHLFQDTFLKLFFILLSFFFLYLS